MLSSMFFLLSGVLWLISEYVLLGLDVGTRRSSEEIDREIVTPGFSGRAVNNVEIDV